MMRRRYEQRLRTSRGPGRAVVLGALTVLSGPIAGAGQPVKAQQLHPVEQGVGDLNPLQTSDRLVPLDLRQPTGWDRVYRLSGDANKNGGRGLFARIDGGIAAVFPWSTYASTVTGSRMPTVPPGTTYYIGGLPPALTDKDKKDSAPTIDRSFNYLNRSSRPAAPERPDLRADNTVDTSARALLRGGRGESPAHAAAQSLWTSESYRRSRLEELMQQATK